MSGSGDLGSLVISLSADIARFESDMGKAVRIAERQSAAIAQAVNIAKTALAVVATGAVAAYVKGLVESAEATNRLSERTGYAVGFLSELGFAMERGNVPAEAWGKALDKFNLSMVNASNSASKESQVFKLLGVDITQGPTEALKQFAERSSAIDDAATKTAVFRLALGKTGDELIPVFKNLEEATETAKRLGITMSEETARNANQLNDALVTLGAQSKALAINGLTPAISALAEMANNIEKAAEKGEKWTQVMREAAKFLIANAGNVAGWFGVSQRPFEAMFNSLMTQESAFAETVDKFQKKQTAIKAPPNSKALNNVLSGDATKQAAELKQYTAALQQMEEKLGKLNNQTEVEATRIKVTTGSLKDLLPIHKQHLLDVAAEVDVRKQLIERIESQEVAFIELNKIYEANSDLVRQSNAANKADLDQRAFEISLIGKTAVEQERLTAARAIDLQLRQRIDQAIANSGDDYEAFRKTADRLTREADAQKIAVDKMISDRLNAERSWSTGARDAFNTYVDNATNAAAQARELFTNAFRNMEDALVNFVKTGKLDFRSLADSIINDLIRIEIRKNMAGIFGSPGVQGSISGGGFGGGIGGGISGVIGKLFGANDPTMSADYGSFGAYATGTDYVPKTGLYQLHEGERVTPAAANDSRGGHTIYINAPGADREGMARLERMIQQVGGSIKPMAAATIREMALRDPGFTRAMRAG